MPLNISRAQFLSLSTLSLLGVALGCADGGGSSSATAASAAAIAAVPPGRGIWFWGSQAQQAIVTGTSSQDTALANFKTWGVTSVYGSYSATIATNPKAVRAWNAKLAAAGIASYNLISTDGGFLPEQWNATQSWLQTNYLGFNSASAPGEGFVGMAFDIEPHAFAGNSTRPSWAAATSAQRRTYMTYFVNMLASSRALLNSNGATSAVMQTYITNWMQSLTSTIAWADAADRNAWFAQLASICDRISVDQYGTNNTSTVNTSFQLNDALLNKKSRAALNSADTVWSSRAAFFTGASAIETATGTFIDIEDYDTTI